MDARSLMIKAQAIADQLIERGDGAAALQVLWSRLADDEADQDLWLKFAKALRQAQFGTIDDPAPLLGVIGAVFDRPGIEYQSLTTPVRQLIWHVDTLDRLRRMDQAGDSDGFAALLFGEDTINLLSTGVIGSVIRKCVLPELAWESLLTRIRAVLLDVAYNETDTQHPLYLNPALACVLAQQCWLNGFVFTRASHEEITAHRLGERILASEDSGDPADVARLAVLACYDGLMEWRLEAEAIELAKTHPVDPFIDMLMLQVAEPMDELEIAKSLPSLGSVSGGISRAVREQDEEHPYPRWVSVDLQRPAPVAVQMSVLIPGIDFSDQVDVTAPRVLVAGCGTGRTLVILPTYFTDATVTGIDLSRRSLSYGARMMAEFGHEKVDLYQAEILSLADWDRRFDIIECGGALHHLEDPMAGWRVLTDLLEPGGLMRISLHSAHARGLVAEIREFIAKERLGSTAGDIRTLRQRIFDRELPWGDVLRWGDFWILEECRDLLFHVEERPFTIPQIEECCAELGLEFLGFEVEDSLRNAVREHGVDPKPQPTPESWRAFEEANPYTFLGMYQFWLRKPGASTLSQ
jgi:SAM-dependent methyltransferase